MGIMEPFHIIDCGLASAVPIRAAQYVRMSTEHQRYSTLNQTIAIQNYAAQRGLQVVRSYTDAGKSGLELKSRPALKQLLQDVVSGRADFSLILVYDVSRWGRFQDTDESAHYEFICRQAGVNVQYCAEHFENDGNPVAALLKSMKRIMAAEYSRELSVRVFNGQKTIVMQGYRMGGPSVYGLRRMLVDEHRSPRRILNPGEHKERLTDRIVLVPGPPEEIKVVRGVFRAYASGKIMREIVDDLNARDIPSVTGGAWKMAVIVRMLHNEQYIGNHVWNRKSRKLGGEKVANGPKDWVIMNGVFTPIISKSLFEKVQERFAKFKALRPKEEMLDDLRRVLAKHGRLSAILIKKDKRCLSTPRYLDQFGGLLNAYKEIGYVPDGRNARAILAISIRKFRQEALAEAYERIRNDDHAVRIDHKRASTILRSSLYIQFTTLRCRRLKDGSLQWRQPPDLKAVIDVVVAVRMHVGNESIKDYLIFPARDFPTGFYLSDKNPDRLKEYTSDSLEPLYALFNQTDMGGVPLRERILKAVFQGGGDI